MELFDSHAHYNDRKFDEDRDEVILKAYNEGVKNIIISGYNIDSSIEATNIASKYDFMYVTCGISPNDIGDTFDKIDKQIEKIENHIKSVNNVDKALQNQENKENKVVGLGEIGLDYYWNKENKELQIYAFKKQIELANKLCLPIVIHSRDAIEDTINVLKECKELCNKKGVFHCCMLNLEFIKEIIKLDFYVSFAGPITFKNSKNANDAIKLVPTNRMLIETDSPYLSPEPLRGKRNDSSNVKYVCEKIADTFYINPEVVAKNTMENTKSLFGIKFD